MHFIVDILPSSFFLDKWEGAYKFQQEIEKE
jgi:hypothetical protein